MLADSDGTHALELPAWLRQGAKSRHNPVEEAARAIQDRVDERLRVF